MEGPFNVASHNQSVDGLGRIDRTGIVRKVIDIRQAASVAAAGRPRHSGQLERSPASARLNEHRTRAAFTSIYVVLLNTGYQFLRMCGQ